MPNRKLLTPEMNWDWASIARLVKAKRDELSVRAGKTVAQGAVGRQYGLDQGQISKLENEGYSEPTLQLEKALTAMLGRIPRLALAEIPDPDEERHTRRDEADPAELRRMIALLRQLYRERDHRDHDWRVLVAVLDVPARSSGARKGRKP